MVGSEVNRAVLQPEVTILHLSGGFGSAEDLKGIVIYIFLEEEPGPSPKAVLVQLLSQDRPFATPRTAAPQASLSFTISWSSFKPMSIESMMPSRHILCHSLFLLPSVFPSFRIGSSVNWLFASGGESTRASASASVLPVNIQG